MMQTRVGWLSGVVVLTKSGAVIFDPSRKKSQGCFCTFISHAHSDHIKGLNINGKGYLTTETKDIIYNRNYKEGELENFISLKYGEKVNIGELEVSVHNSGHILGAAQYVIRDATSTVVYTGDINCREMLTTTAANAIPCDLLILETTYGNPFYVFPSLMDTCVKIVNWAIREIRKGRTPTFVVYSVGKAQEIIKIFNEFTNLPVVVSRSVARVNKAYDKNKVKLMYVESTVDEGKEVLKEQCIQVVSSAEKPTVLNNYSFATATGWSLKSSTNFVDASFPLSNHADFNQLVNYVKLAKPKEVLTIHGFKEDFSRYISKKFGIRARAIPPIKQIDLRSFM